MSTTANERHWSVVARAEIRQRADRDAHGVPEHQEDPEANNRRQSLGVPAT